MDGLLIDSERIWETAQMAVFAEAGLNLTLAMQRAATGMRMQEAMRVWQGFFPGVELDSAAMGARMNARVGEALRAAGGAKPGALAAVDLCLASGCRLAIASSSPPEVIVSALEGLSLFARFQAVVSAVHEPHGKPHPSVYLTAAARLGIPAGECIAFEDSVAGVRSAKAAGMYCVAVPEEHNRGRPEYAEADVVLASLEEFPAVRGLWN
jgi:sugar-phosphatase